MTPSDLLTFIYKNTDEDVIKLFKENPELIRLEFTFAMTPSELLTYIYTNTDDDVIKFFKENPELIRLQFTFVCLHITFSKFQKSVCTCCQKLEILKSNDPIDSFVTELCCYLDRGYCKCLQADKAEEDHSECRPRDEVWNKENAKTSVLHIASALGKKKLVKFIFPKMKCSLHDFWELYHNLDYATGSLKLSPLHIAFINNSMGIFKLLIKRCVYFLCVNSYFIDEISEAGQTSYEHCIASVARSNAADYLNCIISRSKWPFVNHKIEERLNESMEFALCKALNMKSYECASLLADRVREFSIFWNKDCKKAADFVLDSDDDRLFKIFMRIKSLDTSYCLQRLITNGNKNFITILFTKKSKRDLKGEPVPFLTQAVVSDSSLDIIKILLAHCKKDNLRCYHGYSALDWANLLGYKETEKVIKQAGIQESSDKSSPPLHAIFDFENIEFDLCESVKRLIIGGQDVNAVSTNGITPFIKAADLQCNDDINGYSIIRILLQNGAEPFRGIGCTMRVDRQLLSEFIYCNVDIYNTSLFKRLLISQQYEDLFLFLRCANTLPQSYKNALSFLHVHGLTADCNGWALRLKTEIGELLDKPQSLLIACRNRLRRFYGINIHSFVNTCNLPSSMKKLLLLENELLYKVISD